MKTSSIALSALVSLGSLGFTNAYSDDGLKLLGSEIGLSVTQINSLVGLYGENDVHLACTMIYTLFPYVTKLPDETMAHKVMSKVNWSTRAHLSPTCIYSPESAEAAAIGVKIASFLTTPFAIRSGGHTPEPGPASINGGILFSLDNLNQVEIDKEKNIARIGPGNTWGRVYGELEKEGFLVTGGRVSPVGVGGLVTGGGLSFFSGTEGFAADTVQNFEVILSDGSIVNANATSNPDLWWALKGGGNNFGIVTRFDMKAIPKPDGLIYGGNLYFLPYQYPEVLKAIAEFQENGQINDPKAATTISFVRMPSETQEICLINIFHQDPTETVPHSLQGFFDIGPIQNTVTTQPLSTFVTEVYGIVAQAPQMRQMFKDSAIRVSPEMYQYVVDEYKATYEPLNSTPDILTALTYQPISTAMVDVANSTGGRAMGVPREPHVWFCLSTQWTRETDDKLILETAKKFLGKIEKKAKKLGVWEEFKYLNDASVDQNVMQSYGKENLEKMREVASKYDENEVFQKLVPGGYKLK